MSSGPHELLATLQEWLDPRSYITYDWVRVVPALALVGLLLWWWCGREFQRRLRLFVAARLIAPARSTWTLGFRRIRLLLVILALCALCMALARPITATQPLTASRQGVNLIIALDGSKSMLAEDVAPNRFALAQAGIDTLLKSMSGDRAGILFFAGQPTLVAPLTFDTVSLQLISRGLDPELVGKGGTNLAAAIGRAAGYLSRKPYPAKVLILFTDGEETDGDVVLAAQDAYRKQGVRVFTMGSGTADGSAVPRLERNLKRDRVQMGTIRDAEGKPVRSRLDERVLTTAALAGGGTYVDLVAVKGDLTEFYNKSIRPLAAPMDAVPLQDPKEWFQIPLAIALALLVIEMLWPISLKSSVIRSEHASAERVRSLPSPATKGTNRFAATVMLSIGLALASIPIRTHALALADSAAIEAARKLFSLRSFDQALALLQQALLETPDDPLARYNYALAAYADGKYAVAAEAFDKLTASGEPEVEARSQFQLGNSLYRVGAEMESTNPEGSIVHWTKALAAYDRVSESSNARHNDDLTRSALLTVLMKLARNQEQLGDSAARTAAEQGPPYWKDAVSYLDRAIKVSRQDGEIQRLELPRRNLEQKIYRVYIDAADSKRQRAEYQRAASLELAIGQMEAAVSDYTEALNARPEDARAAAGKKIALASLDPWIIDLANQQHAAGVEARQAGFLENAMDLWKTAGGNYAKVLTRTPGHAGAIAGQQKNNHRLHDGYAELGDTEQRRAAESQRTPAERDALLEAALAHYQDAMALDVKDTVTLAKLQALGLRLTGRFVERGQAELLQGRQLAVPKPPDAIASLERSVQSFEKALTFQPKSTPAQLGRKEAEDLLRQLRAVDAERQRTRLADSKRLTNAEDLKDPGKLALKLLNYETDKLASKKEQNFTAPENRPVKDW